jgi:hypothetical protein
MRSLAMEERVKSRDISGDPEVLRLVQEVDASQTALMLTDGDRVVAMLTPVGDQVEHPRSETDRLKRRRGSLRNIIGIGESREPSDVEHHELEYLAEAYEARHE